jgi:hypothetical protein
MKTLFNKFIKRIATAIAQDLQIEILRVATINLQPGDKIILKTKYRVSDITTEKLKDSFAEFFPDHEPIIILEEGMDIQVVRDVR